MGTILKPHFHKDWQHTWPPDSTSPARKFRRHKTAQAKVHGIASWTHPAHREVPHSVLTHQTSSQTEGTSAWKSYRRRHPQESGTDHWISMDPMRSSTEGAPLGEHPLSQKLSAPKKGDSSAEEFRLAAQLTRPVMPHLRENAWVITQDKDFKSPHYPEPMPDCSGSATKGPRRPQGKT
ncbi:large ribosomal subunit protein eL13-like [Rhynchocyon petersi]